MGASGTTPPSVSLEYSVDGGNTWSAFVVGSTTVKLSNVGDSVKIKGVNSVMGTTNTNYNMFILTGSIEASGNVTSIIDGVGGEIDVPKYCFKSLFQNQTALTKTPYMPFRTVGNRGCGYMYYGCTNLQSISDLTATTLDLYSYWGILQNCSLINYVKIYATTINNLSLHTWLNGVSAVGTLVCDSSLTLEVGASGLPDNWTRVDL